jgi:GTPase involved in cell partitioning and DNA repair
MKEFIKKNFTIIVLVISLFGLLKSCNETREITKLRKELTTLKDSVATKSDIRVVNKFMTETQNTLYGFGDSYMSLLNIVGEKTIDNKSTKEAFRMYSNEVELKRKVDKVK